MHRRSDEFTPKPGEFPQKDVGQPKDKSLKKARSLNQLIEAMEINSGVDKRRMSLEGAMGRDKRAEEAAKPSLTSLEKRRASFEGIEPGTKTSPGAQEGRNIDHPTQGTETQMEGGKEESSNDAIYRKKFHSILMTELQKYYKDPDDLKFHRSQLGDLFEYAYDEYINSKKPDETLSPMDFSLAALAKVSNYTDRWKIPIKDVKPYQECITALYAGESVRYEHSEIYQRGVEFAKKRFVIHDVIVDDARSFLDTAKAYMSAKCQAHETREAGDRDLKQLHDMITTAVKQSGLYDRGLVRDMLAVGDSDDVENTVGLASMVYEALKNNEAFKKDFPDWPDWPEKQITYVLWYNDFLRTAANRLAEATQKIEDSHRQNYGGTS